MNGIIEQVAKTLQNLMNPNKPTQLVSDDAEGAKSLYEQAKSQFDQSFDEIEKADKKTHYYLIITNLILVMMGWLISVIGKIDNLIPKGKTIELDFYILMALLLAVSFITNLSLIFYRALSAIRQKKFIGHQTVPEFNESLKKPDRDFWVSLFTHYYNAAQKNMTLSETKKDFNTKIERHLAFLYLTIFLGVASGICYFFHKIAKLTISF